MLSSIDDFVDAVGKLSARAASTQLDVLFAGDGDGDIRAGLHPMAGSEVLAGVAFLELAQLAFERAGMHQARALASRRTS